MTSARLWHRGMLSFIAHHLRITSLPQLASDPRRLSATPYEMRSVTFVSSLPLTRRKPTLFTTSISVHLPSDQHHDCTATSAPQRRVSASLVAPAAILSPAVTATLSSAATAASPFAIWAVLLGAATLGLTSQKYRWGRALTPPVVSTLCTLLLSNFGLLPAAHPIYRAVLSLLVPLAVPLILLGADMRRVFAQTGRLLPVFMTGAVATCVGTMVAWVVVPIKTIGDEAWKIAAALTARHIGGAVNYVAVADATRAPADMVAAALTADNLVVALYFVLLLLLARHVTQPPVSSSSSSEALTEVEDEEQTAGIDDEKTTEAFTIVNAGVSVALSAGMCTLSAFLSALLPGSLGVIPVVTAVVVAVATIFAARLQPYRRSASAVGLYFMQIFFAVAGAGGSIVTVLRKAPVLLVFSVVQLAVHLCFLLVAGRVFGFHKAEMLVASNANVGGPTTAAAMAGSKDWDRLVVPALLVGVFGYSVATFLSLGLGYGVLRMM